MPDSHSVSSIFNSRRDEIVKETIPNKIADCFRLPPLLVGAPDHVGEEIDALTERVERIEQRLSYAEFLAGLSSPVDIVVCPADAPINTIVRKLSHGRK